MKDRPILFSATMVRALLAGTKTQTRRVIKPQPDTRPGMECTRLIFKDRKGNPLLDEALEAVEPVLYRSLCPYGEPGDRLWVRETWQYADWTEDGYPFIAHQADGQTIYRDKIPAEWSPRLMDIWAELSSEKNFSIDNRAADRRWRPSIHMPRWASRITLEITGVRVERLHDISDADSMNEGAEPRQPSTASGIYIHGQYRLGFRDLWEQINGPGSWDANPWVWVIEFKKV